MASKVILESYSESLINDERIFSKEELSLLRSLLCNLRTGADRHPAIRVEVDEIVAAAVGETVAQKTYAMLGVNVVEQVLFGVEKNAGMRDRELPRINLMPMPPSPGPPGVKEPTNVPVAPKPTPSPGPPGSRPTDTPVIPGAPTHGMLTARGSLNERAAYSEIQTARWFTLAEFLAPQECQQLFEFVLAQEANFRTSEVLSPAGGVVDYEHRRSRVLLEVGRYEQLISDRIKSVLPEIFEKLNMAVFEPRRVEAQITASNDGDCFKMHTDNGHGDIASRQLTFVYFFHREPPAFEGGELRMYEGNSGCYETIIPRSNQIVFFPCSVLHEVSPVKCSSRAFADSRFTLNGWLHR